MDHLDALYERVTKPISADAPCGENAKYDERFDKIKSEVMKLTAGSVGMDWNAILINADELLSEKTKDLTLAAYLILGLVKINGYPGLAAGLKSLIFLLDNYWESMFPPVKRQRARVQAFEWINERISIILGTVEVKPEHVNLIKECEILVNELTEKAQNAIPSQQISFASLRSEIAAAANKFPAPAPTSAPTVSTVSNNNSANADDMSAAFPAPESSSESTESEKDIPTAAQPEHSSNVFTTTAPMMATVPETTDIDSIKSGLLAIVKIIKLILEVQPDAPVAYRLGRIALWDPIGAPPTSDAEGRTQIQAPRKQVFQAFEQQLSVKNWNSLRKNAEHAFLSSAPMCFNMDIQRYIFLALQGCGAGEAAEVVQRETGRLLARFSGIVDLSYSTGVPFADGATRAWCEEAVQLVSSAGGDGREASEDTSWQEDAKSMAQSKGIVAALELIQEYINKASCKRDALKRQLFAAKLCGTHNSYHWAIPMLESIHKQMMELNLAQWEPEFCSDVWKNLLKGYSIFQNDSNVDKEELNRRSQIRQLLYDVNLVQAVSVTPKK